ncbi:MAG: UDP-N-acetylglucosamine 2-epimerase (non-hydrolyzing) [Saprospiraceae bacterium]
MKKVIAIIGARPQFIKHFAFEASVQGAFVLKTIHTGQHYDDNMSHVFFDQLKMNKPDYLLRLGGGNHGAQTAAMMIAIEEIVVREIPDLMVVYGDTNSTLAGALVASKLHIPVAHIEAGLRSYNREMPEEINRVLADHVSDLFFIPSEVARKNLCREGITTQVHNVGDIMKDLVLTSISNHWVKDPALGHPYIYATLHRPYNTDEKERLNYVLNTLNQLIHKVVFAIHPRTRKSMTAYGLAESSFDNIIFIDPQGYFENLGYLSHSEALITDSGGMQKEAYWLKKKCVTIRTETEWVETLADGDNVLLFDDLSTIDQELLSQTHFTHDDLYGYGDTAKQIVSAISAFLK